MDERYADPYLKELFSQTTKYLLWLRIEKALIAAIAPPDVSASFDEFVLGFSNPVNLTSFVNACKLEEKKTHHDVGAFLNVLEERSKATYSATFLHRGLTSSDVVDTATCIQVRAAAKRVEALTKTFQEAAAACEDSVCTGYTHGEPAEEFRLGYRSRRVAVSLRKLPTISPHLTGPLGDGKHLGLEARLKMWRLLNMDQPENSRAAASCNYMQCSDRADFADLACTLAINGGLLAKLALDMRLLIFKGELARAKGKREMGSSAMPHKTNPIDLERVCGLARVLRGNSMVAMENIELWLERDISHSSTERMWLPESLHLYCHMLETMTKAVSRYSPTAAMEGNVEEKSEELLTAASVIALQVGGCGRREAWLKVKGEG